MREIFEKWLIERESKSPRTAYQYSRAINRLSRHYSAETGKVIDLYALKDLAALKHIASLYGNSGRYSDLGQFYRAGIRSFCRFREIKENTTSASGSLQQSHGKQQYDQKSATYGFSRKEDLKRTVIGQIESLFPEYNFFGSREGGVNFNLGTHKVDVLLEKENGSLLAIEVIPGLATSEAFVRFSLLLGMLLDKFPDRSVRGCLLAGEIDKSLYRAARTSPFITLSTYSLGLKLNSGYARGTEGRRRSGASFFRSLFILG